MTGQVTAAEVENLYQASKVMANQQQTAREQATRELLQTVILKVVSNQALLSRKDLTPLLNQADHFIDRYRYLRIPTETGFDQQLELNFSEHNLNAGLAALGIPVWQKQRPEMVIWLVINEGDKQTILSADDNNHPAFQQLNITANKRGLPIFFPVMDVQDQHQLRFAQTADKLTADNSIVMASQRYGADVIVLARVQKQGQRSQIVWQWREGEHYQHTETQGGLVQALAAGLGKISDDLASRHGIVMKPAPKRPYQVHIHDVMDFSTYSSTVTYMKGLKGVKEIQVLSLKDNTLSLAMTLSSPLSLFNKIVMADGILSPQGRGQSGQQDDNKLEYRLK